MAHTQNISPVGDWLTGAIRTTSVSVGTTPTALPATALPNRRLLIVYNNSGATIEIGDSTMIVGSGIPLANASSFEIDLDAGVTLYGIEAAGARNVRVFEAS